MKILLESRGPWELGVGMGMSIVGSSRTVDREDAAEGKAVAVAGGPVAGMDEGVVFAPVGKLIPSPEQGVFYLAFHILDFVQEGVGVARAWRIMPAPAHVSFAGVDRHLEDATNAVGVFVLCRLCATFDKTGGWLASSYISILKFGWCHMVLFLPFLLIVGIWHLHMPGSFNSIMPSEVNGLDDWIKLPRWVDFQIT